MGEAKRRKENDPKYGKVKRPSPTEKKKSLFDPSKISKTEWFLWAGLFAGTVGVFLWTYTLS